MKVKYVTGVVGLIVVYLILGVLGAADYEDALLLDKIYKEDVCNGVHPNYKGVEVNCE